MAQVYLMAAALIISAKLAMAHSRFPVFFGFLALACFYVTMEEISWGQRMLGFSTPDFFLDHNLQKEVNLHNFLTGPIQSATKTAIEYALASGLVPFGLVLPLLLRRGSGVARWLEAKGIPAPPLYLWPFFVLSAVLELRLLRFNEAEIAEVLVPMGLCLFAMHCWAAHRHQAAIHDSASWDAAFSRRLALRVMAVFVCVLTLSLATTYVCYASPSLRGGMEDRFLNGVEKFAKRYKRYGQWGTAARLYPLLHAEEPKRASVLRNLAKCFHNAGDEAAFDLYSRKALTVDLQRFEESPHSVPVNLSLASTYDQRVERERAAWHLENALQQGARKVQQNPNSARAAYWLGKAYRRVGDDSMALVQFRRASRLNPRSLKYRKAYLKAQKLASQQSAALSGGRASL